MQRETLLAVIWNTEGDEPEQVAESTRARLESGELEAAGNFRNMPVSYWARDEE